MAATECCKVTGCTYRYGIIDGYCRIHKGRAELENDATPEVSTVEASQTTKRTIKPKTIEDVMAKLDSMDSKLGKLSDFCKILQNENIELTNTVGDLLLENSELKKDISDMKKHQNQLFFKNDAQNQYTRHESFRAHNHKEAPPGQTEDCSQIVIDIAKKVGVTLKRENIQRCHRLGKPRDNGTPRAIICKTNYYPLKKSILDNRKKLFPDTSNMDIDAKNALIKQSVFLTEDLSPFRGKIFRYVKEWNKTSMQYDIVTTSYGKIVLKVKNTEKEWKNISTTDDFLKVGIPYDDEFKKEFTEIWT